MVQILLIAFGVIALANGSFKITRNRQVTDSTARFLGVVLLIGAFTVPFIALIAVIIIGLFTSEKIVPDEPIKAKNEFV